MAMREVRKTNGAAAEVLAAKVGMNKIEIE